MKKIINGKVYDSETAKLVGHWNLDESVTDFSWYEEDLYRKKTGEYFIHGSGNAASKYAEHAYGSWEGGAAIIPLTFEQARDWAEEHLEADEYIAEFGDPGEGDEDVQILVKVSPRAKAILDELRSREGITLSQAVERFIMG